VVALDLKDGHTIWKTYTCPPSETGFSGNAVWGSSPVFDEKRNSIYVATGNNYEVPQGVLDCMNNTNATVAEKMACVAAVPGSSENYFDSVLALDATTGAVKWHFSGITFDGWNVGCIFGNCDGNGAIGPDWDFAQGPALFKTKGGRELVGAGQKSGQYWALNPDDGTEVWHNDAGPGGVVGGMEWGSAVDGKRVYIAEANSTFVPWTFTKGLQVGRTVVGGFWAALDASTGALIWEAAGTKTNGNGGLFGFVAPPGNVAMNEGAVTTANGVVYAGACDTPGTMYAMDARTGKFLWEFESGGAVNSGCAIVDGVIYWGSGYVNFNFSAGNKLYAFHVPKRSGEDKDDDDDDGNDD
jgi:polyvinyl alcohol dehydrogenase (cytochrome)